MVPFLRPASKITALLLAPFAVLGTTTSSSSTPEEEPMHPRWPDSVVVLDPSMENLQETLANIFSEQHPRSGFVGDWESRNYTIHPQKIGDKSGGFFNEGAEDPGLCAGEFTVCYKNDPPTKKCDSVYPLECKSLKHRGRHFDRKQSRVQVFLKPGLYPNTELNVGYYQSFSGLGKSQGDVKVKKLQVLNGGQIMKGANGLNPACGLNNFWRSAENFTVEETAQISVSQAAPLRKLTLQNDLELAVLIDGLRSPPGKPGPFVFYAGKNGEKGSPGAMATPDMGFTSGGFMAEMEVRGKLDLGTQQQFMIKDSMIKQGIKNAGWSVVTLNTDTYGNKYAGNAVLTDVSDASLPNAAKPYVILQDDGYYLQIPAVTEKGKIVAQAETVPFSRVFVAKEGEDAKLINQKLAEGKHIVLAPGIYDLSEPLKLENAIENQTLLGLGWATLEPRGAFAAVEIAANARAPRVAAVTLQPGSDPYNKAPNTFEGSTLLTVHGAAAEEDEDHTIPHVVLSDLFARVGGDNSIKETGERSVDTIVAIHRNRVILENLWLWRADHDVTGIVSHNQNRVNTGLLVTGSDVVAYGLASEHTLQNDVDWRGASGKTVFYQNELLYELSPETVAWQAGKDEQYFGYKAAGAGHELYGGGVYAYYRDFPGNNVGYAIAVREDAFVHNALTVFLPGLDGSIVSTIGVLQSDNVTVVGDCGGISGAQVATPHYCQKQRGRLPVEGKVMPNKLLLARLLGKKFLGPTSPSRLGHPFHDEDPADKTDAATSDYSPLR